MDIDGTLWRMLNRERKRRRKRKKTITPKGSVQRAQTSAKVAHFLP